jgi:hypothetical protein
MTKTKIVSLRIPVESYRTIMDECKKKGITMTEWYERKIALAKQRIPKPIPETIPEPIIIKEKPVFSKYIPIIFSMPLLIIIFIACFGYYKENKENKGITQKYGQTLDSLYGELFIKQKEAARYEIALELFKEEDSVAADKFHFILVTKTE